MINNNIASALNEPGVSRVLTIYGNSHRELSDPVWSAALGPGEDMDLSQSFLQNIPAERSWSSRTAMDSIVPTILRGLSTSSWTR